MRRTERELEFAHQRRIKVRVPSKARLILMLTVFFR